ncbi:glycosyl hydrolase superfamily protein [Striga asiatica]|uniref:Glycosyl hydrolase superfamily protein n=1 Tax=Striga asiatica TaxID=4170 RepID=A0A5A7QA04_STRAF|nr:glycosyl hydrolase superfamily protein [Striga asiatica]
MSTTSRLKSPTTPDFSPRRRTINDRARIQLKYRLLHSNRQILPINNAIKKLQKLPIHEPAVSVPFLEWKIHLRSLSYAAIDVSEPASDFFLLSPGRREAPFPFGPLRRRISHWHPVGRPSNRHPGRWGLPRPSRRRKISPQEYWDIGDASYRCLHCGARFWYAERLGKPSNPRVPKIVWVVDFLKFPLLKCYCD